MAFHKILDTGFTPRRAPRSISTMDDGLAFYLSELTSIDPKLYEVKYSHIQYDSLIPIQMYPEHADSYTYFSYDGNVVGKFLGANARDIPMADINRSMSTEQMFYGGIGYRYSLDELRSSQAVGMPLDLNQQKIAIRGFQEHAQQVAYFGDSDRNLTGLLNNANVQIVGSTTSFKADAGVARSFAQELLRKVWVGSVEIHVPNVLLMSPTIFSLLSDTPSITVANGAAYQSELAFLQQNNIYTQLTGLPLTIKPLVQLEDASDAGGQRMVAYELNDENLNMGMAISQRFLPPQPDGNFLVVPGEYKFGGCAIRYLGSMAYGDDA